MKKDKLTPTQRYGFYFFFSTLLMIALLCVFPDLICNLINQEKIFLSSTIIFSTIYFPFMFIIAEDEFGLGIINACYQLIKRGRKK